MHNSFSINEAIKFGWATFKANKKFWLIAFLLTCVLSSPGIDLGKNKSKEQNTTFKDKITANINVIEREYENVLGVSDTNKVAIVGPEELIMRGEDPTPALDYPNIDNKMGNPNNFGAPPPPINPMFKKLLVPLLIIVVPFAIITGVLVLALCIYIGLIAYVIKIGFMRLTLDAVRQKPLQFQTLLSDVNLRKSLRVLLAGVSYGMLVVIGLMLFILPGLYFAYKYMFVVYAVVDKDVSLGEAFKLSGQITKGNLLRLFTFSMVTILIVILGFLAFVVGVIPASIVLSLANSYIYIKLSEPTTALNENATQATPLQAIA